MIFNNFIKFLKSRDLWDDYNNRSKFTGVLLNNHFDLIQLFHHQLAENKRLYGYVFSPKEVEKNKKTLNSILDENKQYEALVKMIRGYTFNEENILQRRKF